MSNLYILLTFVSVRNEDVHKAISQVPVYSPKVTYRGEFVLETGAIHWEKEGVNVTGLFNPAAPESFQITWRGTVHTVMATYRPNSTRIQPRWEIQGIMDV